MADEEAPVEEEEVTEEGGSNKKLIIIIAAGVLVLALGGGAAFFMMGSSDTPASTGDESAETASADGSGESTDAGAGDGEKSADAGEGNNETAGDAEDEDEGSSGSKITFGSTFSLEPFNINLGNPLENRYVRMQIALEYRNGAEQKKELDARLPQLRDAVISVTSKKTREFLLGPDGKDQLRLEILNRVNQYLDRKVEAVYIMDILIE